MAISQISHVAASEEEEEWRAVVGCEGLYEVSSLGTGRLRPDARTPLTMTATLPIRSPTMSDGTPEKET